MKIPQYPNDRDYFTDKTGNIYQVIGFCHFPDKIHCLKKYEVISEEDSKQIFHWHSDKTGLYYKRAIPIYSAKTAEDNINQDNYKEFSTLYGSDFILYPKDKIEHYLNPKKILHEFRESFMQNKWDAISKTPAQIRNAVEISYIFEEELGIPPEDIGLTGSAMWGGIHEKSDIDIIIYGIQNTHLFLKNYMKLFEIGKRFKKLTVSQMFSIASKFSMKTGLSVEDCVVYTSKKRYLMYFGKYYLSIAFCPKIDEIQDNPIGYEDTITNNVPTGTTIRIQATILNDEWGYFYPEFIEIGGVQVLETNRQFKLNKEQLEQNLNRLLIFEREISGYFEIGDRVEIQGLLQEVNNASSNQNESQSRVQYQLVIGTAENYGNEFIKNIKLD